MVDNIYNLEDHFDDYLVIVVVVEVHSYLMILVYLMGDYSDNAVFVVDVVDVLVNVAVVYFDAEVEELVDS